MKKFNNKNYIAIFTKEANNNLQNILKKFNLETSLKELGNLLSKIENYSEKEKIIESLSQTRLIKAVKNLSEEKINKDDFSSFLEKDLMLPKIKSENLFADLENNVLPFIEKNLIEENKSEKSDSLPKRNNLILEKKSESILSPQKKFSQPDSYREKVD